MIFEFTKNQCALEVLQILFNRKTKYSEMFRKTKVSHTTLQSVLRELATKEFILKYNIGHQNVDYEITLKGKELLKTLSQLKEIIK